MSKYLIEFQETNTSALVEYDELGLMTKFELSKGEFTEHQVRFFNGKFPRIKEDLEWFKTNTKAKIKEIAMDLSFQTFWDVYANKVGNKEKAIKTWDKLPDTEKVKALKWLPTYETQIAIQKVAKMYPETFLNQKRWNN